MQDDLPVKVVRTNTHDEIIARAANLLVGRAAYETARRMYPRDRIDYRCGATNAELLAAYFDNRTGWALRQLSGFQQIFRCSLDGALYGHAIVLLPTA
jgi:hypothetical protein